MATSYQFYTTITRIHAVLGTEFAPRVPIGSYIVIFSILYYFNLRQEEFMLLPTIMAYLVFALCLANGAILIKN